VEKSPEIQSRLNQLNREPCYRDAILGLGSALLEKGYPREAANISQTFAKRCGNPDGLPLAYTALERLNDFPGALAVLNELIGFAPANGGYRYWRALTYDKLSQPALAVPDYLSRIELIADQKSLHPEVFYNLSRAYDALGRPCDAITPMEMYVSLDPVTRRTPQVVKIISDYAAKGNCDARYATGKAQVSFASTTNVRPVPVVLNGVAGNFILDTGATLVVTTEKFAVKAQLHAETGQSIVAKTVGGIATCDIAHATAVAVGRAAASGVVTGIVRGKNDPFGGGFDGLLGMSFLSRFKITLSANVLELEAIPIR
jgi:aspartyl protease family protein